MNHVPTPGDWNVSAPDETGSASTRLDRIGTVLAGEVTSGRVPGAVIGILRYGKLAYLRTVG
jgi:hypothetical protein